MRGGAGGGEEGGAEEGVMVGLVDGEEVAVGLREGSEIGETTFVCGVGENGELDVGGEVVDGCRGFVLVFRVGVGGLLFGRVPQLLIINPSHLSSPPALAIDRRIVCFVSKGKSRRL